MCSSFQFGPFHKLNLNRLHFLPQSAPVLPSLTQPGGEDKAGAELLLSLRAVNAVPGLRAEQRRADLHSAVPCCADLHSAVPGRADLHSAYRAGLPAQTPVSACNMTRPNILS